MSSTQQNEIQAEFKTADVNVKPFNLPADKGDVGSLRNAIEGLGEKITQRVEKVEAEVVRVDTRVTALASDLKPVMVTSLHMAGRHEEAYALAGEKIEEGFFKGTLQKAKTWTEIPTTPKTLAIDAAKGLAGVAVYELVTEALDAALPKPGLINFVKSLWGSGKKR